MMRRGLDVEEVMEEGHHNEFVTDMLWDMMGMMEMMAHLEMMLEDGAGARTKHLLLEVLWFVEHAEELFQESLSLFGEGEVGSQDAEKVGDVLVGALRLQVVVGGHATSHRMLIPLLVVFIDVFLLVIEAGIVCVQGLVGGGKVPSPRHSCKQQKPTPVLKEGRSTNHG